MRKKILSVILSIVLLMSVAPAYAAGQDVLIPGLYVATPNCPQEYIDYTEANVSRFILSVHGIDISDITIGSPFAFAESGADVFYFPIMLSGTIKYLFRVYRVGDSFSGVISEFLANDLEQLSLLTSAETPMYLKLEEGEIIAQIGDNEYILFQYPQNMEQSNGPLLPFAEEKYSVQNVKNVLPNVALNLSQPRDINIFVPLDIKERQVESAWCTAYSLATVIRTLKHNAVTARTMMSMALGEVPAESVTFPWESILSVSSKFGFYPYVLRYMPPNQTLINELSSNRPCLLWMQAPSGGHTVVLCGYNTQGTWCILNPWYTQYEYFPADGYYLPMGKDSSSWVFSMYAAAYKFDGTF